MAIAGNRALTVDGERALPVIAALDSETRLMILSILSHNPMNFGELAEAMSLPPSTVSFHLKPLEQAGLLIVEYVPGTRGRQKLISKRYDEIRVKLPGVAIGTDDKVIEVSMPIGNYRRLEAEPTCGLASENKFIGRLDDPRSFHEPDHVFAQIIWFRSGFVEYTFPDNIPYGARPLELELSVEICSEAPQYDPDWPSDITLWVNDVEVGTWTSPGDFGGEKAALTPNWWREEQTTHGMLKFWRVTPDGSFIDGDRLSDVTLDDLKIGVENHITVRLGVKRDARNVGGVNLFGRRWGNYPQDLVMRLPYDYKPGHKSVKLK